MFVEKASPELELVARNSMNALLMSTPASSDGAMFMRAHRHLYALGAGPSRDLHPRSSVTSP